MRVKTRSGLLTTIPDGCVVKQEKRVSRHDVYYVLHLQDSRTLSVTDPVDGIPCETVVERRAEVKTTDAPPYNPPKLQRAEECPSAGGAMTASRAIDEHASEKVKGEVFFTHKTSPGLVIKSPKGEVVHETKMSDMYKRRDS